MLDFLYKKVDCYYCKVRIKQKDAIDLKIVVHGELKEELKICRRCAMVIKYIGEAAQSVNERPIESTKKMAQRMEKVIAKEEKKSLKKPAKKEEKLRAFSGESLKYVKSENK